MSQKSFVELFDMVRIINMTSRTDRREETIQEFQRGHLPVGTDQIDFFPAVTPDAADGFSTRGAKGCYMSHLEILREAQARKARHLLVLEDDIAFVRDINMLGADAFRKLQELDWDLAYFGHILSSHRNNPEWRIADQPMFTSHCYAVNGKALPELIRLLEGILTRPPGDPQGGPMHYDAALNWFFRHNVNIKAYYYTYCLGFQRPSATNIHKPGTLDRLPLISGLLSFARYIKREYLRMVR